MRSTSEWPYRACRCQLQRPVCTCRSLKSFHKCDDYLRKTTAHNNVSVGSVHRHVRFVACPIRVDVRHHLRALHLYTARRARDVHDGRRLCDGHVDNRGTRIDEHIRGLFDDGVCVLCSKIPSANL